MVRSLRVWALLGVVGFFYGMPAAGLWAQTTADGAKQQVRHEAQGEDDSGEVTVAWITAFGTIGAALISAVFAAISAVWARSEKKRADQLEAGSRAVGKDLQAQLIDRYGFRCDVTFVRVEIQNLDGDTIITRGWKGVEIVQDVTLASIPMKSRVDSPKGKLICPPTLIASSADGAPFPKAVSLVPIQASDRNCHYAIEITGTLTRADPELTLSTQLEVQAAYVMSYEDMLIAYGQSQFKQEYHGFSVEIPTRLLEVEVRFPPGFRVKSFPGVFLLGTELIHSSELNQVRKGFQELEGGARFTVENPLIGFSYLVYWTPPRKSP